MITNGFSIIVPRHYKTTPVVIAVLAGTEGRSMSSSFNTDLIPEKIRRIFDEPDTEKWFVVYYLTKHSEIIARVAFFFEGRDKTYVETCEAAVDGTLARVVIVYRSKTNHYEVKDDYVRNVTKGTPFKMTINGDIIP